MSKTENQESIAKLSPGVVLSEPVTDLVPAEERQLTTTNSSSPFTITGSSLCKRVKIYYSVTSGVEENVASEGDLIVGNSSIGWSRLWKTGTEPLTVLVVKIEQYYKEWLSSDAFNAGNRPRRYATDKEALADGHTLAWGPNGERPSVALAYDVFMLVKKPDDYVGEDIFNIYVGNEAWAPTVITIDKASAPVVRDFFTNLLMSDASMRHVPQSQGRTTCCFCTLSTVARTYQKSNRKARIVTFRRKMDDKYQVVVPTEEFMTQLQDLLVCLANPSGNPTMTGDDEDLPF